MRRQKELEESSRRSGTSRSMSSPRRDTNTRSTFRDSSSPKNMEEVSIPNTFLYL